MAEGHAAGGSIQLAQLIDQYGEHIYRDLHEYAGGLNLVEALRDGSGYSPRQILVLIKGLPSESATVAAMRGGSQFRGWGVDRYMLANLTDAVRENTFAIVVGNAKNPKKVEEPEAIYRPKADETEKKTKSNNQFALMLARAKAAKAARKQGA